MYITDRSYPKFDQNISFIIKIPFHQIPAWQEFLSRFPPWRHRNCCIRDIHNIFGQQTPSFRWPEVSFPNVCLEVSCSALRGYLIEKTNIIDHHLLNTFKDGRQLHFHRRIYLYLPTLAQKSQTSFVFTVQNVPLTLQESMIEGWEMWWKCWI